jgi:hypothetical protein
MSKRSSEGGSIGGALFGLLILIALIPKPVWIAFGVAVAITLVCWLVYRSVEAWNKHVAEREELNRLAEAERTAAERQRRIDTLGKANAARLESALDAVERVAASEAAQAGWLGDVDFSADIQQVTANFEKVHALRAVTTEMSRLTKPSAEDRRILAEAKATADKLERAGIERVDLIGKCAKEAELIDKSLRTEREDARVAEQRAELHAKLSAMLYGIEAAPDTTPTDSAVDAVMARVAAYREIKQQIHQARQD